MVVAHVAKIPKQPDARMWQERGGVGVGGSDFPC